MSARRKKPVTLANIPARYDGPRDKVVPGNQDATPERLSKARKNSHKVKASDRGQDGAVKVDAAAVDASGVRRLADPFDVLKSRGLLAVGQPEMNEVLWHAGNQYREHWHGAGMEGAQAMDLTRDIVDGGTGVVGISEHVLGHAQQLRAANRAIGPRCAAFVVGIVLRGATVTSLAHLVRESGNARTSEAIVLERLREGLHRLCDLWGMKPDDKGGKIRRWRGFGEEWVEKPDSDAEGA